MLVFRTFCVRTYNGWLHVDSLLNLNLTNNEFIQKNSSTQNSSFIYKPQVSTHIYWPKRRDTVISIPVFKMLEQHEVFVFFLMVSILIF